MTPLFRSLFLLIAIGSMCEAKQVSVTIDGESFQCGPGGGATDPNCVQILTEFCHSKTSFSSSECFTKSSDACRAASPNYADCVKKMTDYCYSKTTMSTNECFEQSLGSCRGQFRDMVKIFDSVKASRR